MRKKILSVILSIVLVFSSIGFVFAEDKEYIDGDLKINIINKSKTDFHMTVDNINTGVKVDYFANKINDQTILNYNIT